jgi:hypothetical protein
MNKDEMVSREAYQIQLEKSKADRQENKWLREKNGILMNNYRELIEELKDYKSTLEKRETQIDLFWKMYEVQKGEITKLKLLLNKEQEVTGASTIKPNERTILKMSKLDEDKAKEEWKPEKGSRLNPF